MWWRASNSSLPIGVRRGQFQSHQYGSKNRHQEEAAGSSAAEVLLCAISCVQPFCEWSWSETPVVPALGRDPVALAGIPLGEVYAFHQQSEEPMAERQAWLALAANIVSAHVSNEASPLH